jgi:hypothetical protein
MGIAIGIKRIKRKILRQNLKKNQSWQTASLNSALASEGIVGSKNDLKDISPA